MQFLIVIFSLCRSSTKTSLVDRESTIDVDFRSVVDLEPVIHLLGTPEDRFFRAKPLAIACAIVPHR